MKELENLRELYLDEIKKINKKGDLTPADSEAACKALEAIKKIDELCGEMSGQEYSQKGYSQHDFNPNRMPEMSNMYPYGFPYYNDGYSERRGRNQRNGQYISRNGYSRHDDTVNSMIGRLESMRMEAPDEMTRRAIDRCIEKLEDN